MVLSPEKNSSPPLPKAQPEAQPEVPPNDPPPAAPPICFGLDRATDERSLAAFLARFASRRLLDTLAPRLEEAEIAAMVDYLGRIMKKHLSHREYHQLFLQSAPEEEPEP